MSAVARTKANLNEIFAQAVDTSIRKHGEVGLHVAIYQDGEPMVDVWGGIADPRTGRKVDAETLFPVFSVSKSVTATALHIQAERGLIEYSKPIAHYWPEFAAHGKDKATITDALSHRAGVPQMPEGVTPELMADYDWMVDQTREDETYVRARYDQCLSLLHLRLDHRGDRAAHRSEKPAVRRFRARGDLRAPWNQGHLARHSRRSRAESGTTDQCPRDAASARRALLQGNSASGRLRARGLRSPGRATVVLSRRGRNHERAQRGAHVCDARQWRRVGRRPPALAQRVRSFSNPRPHTDDEPDAVLGFPVRVGTAGYWLGGPTAPAVVGGNLRTICHPGAGGSIGWANTDLHLAGAICHNRMFNAPDDPFAPIAEAIRQTLGE